VKASQPTAFNPSLALYAKCVVGATFVLLFIGGLVTSYQAGMAVPDWPLSFGSLNPEGWWGNFPVRLEHGHRLFAMVIGLLVTVLAVWVFLARTSSAVRWLAGAAFIGVIVQGVMGGLRVTLNNDHLMAATIFRVAHGCTAQIELCLLVALAVMLSRGWTERSWKIPGVQLKAVRRLAWIVVFAIFGQLIFGATMRHLGAGLAIPTFPEANAEGGWMPKVHNKYIDINFSHTRVGAVGVTLLVLALTVLVLRQANGEGRLANPATGLLGLLLVQLSLGIAVVLHLKPVTLTTIHVVNGAAVLALSLLLAMRVSRFSRESALSLPAQPLAEANA
jgi:cytochrome c oxidase assembly protein subunit 15